MARLLSISIPLLLFFLNKTHGISIEDRGDRNSESKEHEQVPMFRIEITGTIHNSKANQKKYGILTKLIFYKDDKIVTEKRGPWIGGKYKLVVEIPESEKNGAYKLVASSPLHKDDDSTFYVVDSSQNPRLVQCNVYNVRNTSRSVNCA